MILMFPNPAYVDEEADVYVLWGQSNTMGHGALVQLPSYLSGPQTDTRIYRGTSTGFQTLEAGVNAGWPQAAVDYGPEMRLAFESRRRFNRPVFLIKHAIGGTRLAPTSAPTWNPDVRGSYYDTATNEMTAALTAIRNAGYTPVVRGFLWGQGESDAQNSVTQATYQDRLTKLFNGVRTTLGIPALPIADMLVRSETYTAGVPAINAAKAAVATSLGSKLIKTEAMEDKGDDLHLSGRAQQAFGRHAFEAMLSLSFDMPASLPARFFELDFSRQSSYTTSALHTVSDVLDRSGNGRGFTQATATARPAFFDGVGAFEAMGVLRSTSGKAMTGAANPVGVGAPFTLYMVMTCPTVSTSSPRIFFSMGNTASAMFIFRNGSNLLELGISSSSVLKSSVPTLAGDTQIVVVGYGGATGSFMRINGVQVAADTLELPFNSGVAMCLFDSPNANNGATTRNAVVDVAMNGGFSQKLSLADTEKLEGFLAQRLGLTALLPDAHPYKTAVPV